MKRQSIKCTDCQNIYNSGGRSTIKSLHSHVKLVHTNCNDFAQSLPVSYRRFASPVFSGIQKCYRTKQHSSDNCGRVFEKFQFKTAILKTKIANIGQSLFYSARRNVIVCRCKWGFFDFSSVQSYPRDFIALFCQDVQNVDISMFVCNLIYVLFD